jgi:hypothetical protein
VGGAIAPPSGVVWQDQHSCEFPRSSRSFTLRDGALNQGGSCWISGLILLCLAVVQLATMSLSS